MTKQPAVYIVASKRNGTLYIGVTSDLVKRIWQHRNKEIEGFTYKYNVTQLVYFEFHADMASAILKEKQLKKWKRHWKLNLIEKENPHWIDLWDQIIDYDYYITSFLRKQESREPLINYLRCYCCVA